MLGRMTASLVTAYHDNFNQGTALALLAFSGTFAESLDVTLKIVQITSVVILLFFSIYKFIKSLPKDKDPDKPKD